ncbi:hypothetical protein JVU11DRAFT_5717 [Chiua virens]|nr:hypothetical protein JVU11DRAFT_5717 [Chiua virens]
MFIFIPFPRPEYRRIFHMAQRSRDLRASPSPEPYLAELGWRMNEAKYIALVFGDGTCEVCGKNTREIYMSFAARIRLCSNWYCRKKFRDEHLVRVNWLAIDLRECLLVPCVESNMCFRASFFSLRRWCNSNVTQAHQS